MQKLAVVLFPRIDASKIDLFRKKNDFGTSILHPHITIIPPLTTLSPEQLVEHVEKRSKNTRPFPIRLNGVSKTEDDCIFLLVKEGGENVMRMYQKLHSEKLSSRVPQKYRFILHMTLGEREAKSPDEFEKAFSEAKGFNYDYSCVIDSISIIQGDGVRSPDIIKTILFLSTIEHPANAKFVRA